MDEEIKKIMLKLTAHADDLELYANGIAEDAAGELAATESAIYALIYALYQRYGETGFQMDYRTSRYLDMLKRKIREIRAAAFDEAEDDLTEAAGKTVREESGFWGNIFAFLTGAAAAAPTKSRMDKIAKYGIYNGNTRKQIFDRVSSGDINRIYDAVADSLQKGKTVAEAIQAVRAELEKTRRFVKYEIEAIVNGVANDAALEFAAANRSKLRYSAVLDDKVCSECAALDGNIYEFDDPDIPALPRHIKCRCRLVPMPDGNETAEPATFAEYLASLTPDEQRKRLGNAKFAAWKSGNYELKAYETPNIGQRMSIEEVKMRGGGR